jgi:hypothetical protein
MAARATIYIAEFGSKSLIRPSGEDEQRSTRGESRRLCRRFH